MNEHVFSGYGGTAKVDGESFDIGEWKANTNSTGVVVIADEQQPKTYEFDIESIQEPRLPLPVPKPDPIVCKYERIGRNDKCSCGSGVKFKKCCADKFPAEYVRMTTHGVRR